MVAFVQAAAAVVLLASCGDAGIAPTPAGDVIAVDDRVEAPRLGGELVGDGQFDADTSAGAITVVNFWGSWCGPCRVEMTEFQDVARANEDVVFVGINVRDQEVLAQEFLQQGGITYPSIYDPAGELLVGFSAFPVTQTPSTVLIDADGQVAAAYLGAVSGNDLQAALDVLAATSD